jgi:hypothetical protein
LNQAFKKAHTTRISAILFDLIETTEFDPSAPQGFLARQASPNVLLNLVLNMKP